MQRPGTAVLDVTARLDAESAAITTITRTGFVPMRRSATGAGAASDPREAGLPGPLTLAGVPSGLGLPCRDDPELFFAELPEDVERAKALCTDCPARLACLAGAAERREPWGVWGGELFLRGEIVPRKRPRGRPRKDEQAA